MTFSDPTTIVDVTAEEEALLQRLTADDVDESDVLAYLAYQSRNNFKKAAEEFFKPGDLDHFKRACAWWPEHKEMPVAIRRPHLRQLCFNYAEPLDETFMDRLTALASKAAAWQQEHAPGRGRKRIHEALPGESEEDRIRRLNRERVARHRARKLTEQDAAIAAAHKEWMAACAKRAEAMRSWDAYVAVFYQRWLDAKSGQSPIASDEKTS